jgi:hypothetical protein
MALFPVSCPSVDQTLKNMSSKIKFIGLNTDAPGIALTVRGVCNNSDGVVFEADQPAGQEIGRSGREIGRRERKTAPWSGGSWTVAAFPRKYAYDTHENAGQR